MPARKSPPERSRSGSYVHEHQRSTAPVKLRLEPLAAQAMREGAERRGQSLSDYVSALVLADIPEE